MARTGMDLEQFNQFMRRCKGKMAIRYIQPTIHPHFSKVTAINIHTSTEIQKFNVTNNADEDFNLDVEVNKFIDTLN